MAFYCWVENWLTELVKFGRLQHECKYKIDISQTWLMSILLKDVFRYGTA